MLCWQRLLWSEYGDKTSWAERARTLNDFRTICAYCGWSLDIHQKSRNFGNQSESILEAYRELLYREHKNLHRPRLSRKNQDHPWFLRLPNWSDQWRHLSLSLYACAWRYVCCLIQTFVCTVPQADEIEHRKTSLVAPQKPQVNCGCDLKICSWKQRHSFSALNFN